jgi:hypothetical protein
MHKAQIAKIALYVACSIAVLVAGGIIYFSYNPVESDWFPKCPFLLLTGLKCPGCGSQRAIHALLHLDIHSAFRHNALLLVSIPYIILLFIAKIVQLFSPASVFQEKIQPVFFIWFYFALVILFWIARNIWDF